jgi:beta-aspartyl-peptidase (threonine type)
MTQVTPVVVASSNGIVGIEEAVAVLRRGGSALDAVEAGIRLVELNPDDHSVGYGGLPNMLGEVELDASIMDGRTLAAGAVGALRGYVHAISVARKVMEELPHVFLVGPGAERFAAEMGFEGGELLTEAARARWREIMTRLGAGAAAERQAYFEAMRRRVAALADPTEPNETVNFIALDAMGNLASGVSTSGWAWKYPGRLGDSPVIGAGNYADSRYGAAACTGRGEMAIRAATAHSIVMYMKFGASVDEGCRRAIEDLRAVVDPYAGVVSVIAMDPLGNHAAASNRSGGTYIAMSVQDTVPRQLPRRHVP